MLLRDLNSGTLFQFARNQTSANVYMAVRPDEGTYRIVGLYVRGEPLPFCSFPGCPEHGQTVKTERPERAVRARSIAVESPLYKWLSGETDYVTHSAGHPHAKLSA